jgi:adenine-specific DNA-methyltransferase
MVVNTSDIIISEDIIEKKYSKKTSIGHRKKFAQFFTPFPIALLMSKWLLGNEKLETVLEPAFGLGIFTRALLHQRREIEIKGFEVDETIFAEAKNVFNGQKNVNIQLEDYMYNDWNNRYDGIICNPPYFKFHDYDNKLILNEIENHLKVRFNGFTNLYTLFLLKSIYQLNPNGRVAYVIPSEFLNSDYGKLVKASLIKSKVLRHIVVINFKENVFDDALTTACIVLCSNDKHYERVRFTSIRTLEELNIIQEYINNYPSLTTLKNTFQLKELDPEVKWRKFYQEQKSLAFKNLVPFSSVAKVVRGIATGANDYFTFSFSKAKKFRIEEKYLLPCICKAMNVKSSFFTNRDYEYLKENDRPIFLLNAKGVDNSNVKEYIELGVQQGINQKYLTACRSPWYSLENRPPAPIWVSVFNRNGLKFIRNEAGISNLTTFHCIYPVQSSLFQSINIDLLFAYLLTDTAKLIFEDNRREYGNGLQKFEPNDLNRGKIINLALIDQKTEIEILNLYNTYRKTALQSMPDESLIMKINNIIIGQFGQF